MQRSIDLSADERKEWAKQLYTILNCSAPDTALKTATDEDTIKRWAWDGNWDKLRRSMLTAKEQQLRILYDILDALLGKAKENIEASDIKDADKIIKYTAAIKNLESETNIAEMVQTGKRYIDFLLKMDVDKAKESTLLFDAFIKEQLKK